MKIIKNILSTDDNLKIIKHLLRAENWMMAYDNNRNDVETVIEHANIFVRINRTLNMRYLQSYFSAFKGMSMTTYNTEMGINSDPYLNDWGDRISKIVCKKAKIKKYEPIRYFWNFYRPSDVTEWHLDKSTSGFKSFVYNLHDSDGGTEVGKKIYYDKEGEAKLFNSHARHRGLGPTETNFRLNLNCIIKLK
jgi:hypothetical protein|tara:strand:+ start:1576 stop:2151 length:576 start_codon:yes stop_codon:yes gene_type:complete